MDPVSAASVRPMRPIGIALLGFAHPHQRGWAASFQESRHVGVVCAWDDDQERGEAAAAALGVPFDTDLDAVLGRDDVQAVTICSTNDTHAALAVAAAQAGTKGIVCEKPMAMDLTEADEMLAACRASGSRLTISHQRYYMPQYARARQLIADGAIGRVVSAEASLKPGCLMTDGTHTIHMLLALLGDPEVDHLLGQVDGHEGYEYYGHRCENAGIAFLAFTNQVRASMVWGWMAREAAQEGRNRRQLSLDPGWNDEVHRYHHFVIHGDEGRLELYGDVFRSADLLNTPALRIFRGSHVEEIEIEWPAPVSAIGLEIKDLIETIETGAPHPLDGENGRKVTEVMVGIYESARRRSVIKFPVNVRDNPFLAMCETGDFPPQGDETGRYVAPNERERWRAGSEIESNKGV